MERSISPNGTMSPSAASRYGGWASRRSDDAMQVILVRHGETQWNVEGREIGQLDSSLTSRGLEQAERLAERLAKLNVTVVYSSDLGRARQTAEIIATACHVPVKLEPSLRERHMGIFEGLTAEEQRMRYQAEWENFRADPDFPIPGGESGAQRTKRTIEVMNRIAERHSDDLAVAVTHSGVLRGWFEYVLKMPTGQGQRFRRDHASYNAFDYDGQWVLATWNDVSHLPA